jgi:hypothetical protein
VLVKHRRIEGQGRGRIWRFWMTMRIVMSEAD